MVNHYLKKTSHAGTSPGFIRGYGFLLLGLMCSASFAQKSLKFEQGAGPSGSGASTTNKVVSMSYGDSAQYTPALTVTYSLSEQAYTSIEGSASTPGVVFGADINGSGNSMVARNYYGLVNQVGSSTNAHYSTGGIAPGINVANDYAINVMAFTDALITSSGSNIMPTSTKNIYFAKLTLTFNRPVSDPVIHLTGMGGFYQASGSSGSLGLAAGLKLNDPGNAYTISKLAGNTFFVVSNTDKTIYNSASQYTSATNTSSPSGASGSVKVTGNNITTLTFDVLMNGDGNGSSAWSATNRVNGDIFLVSVSLAANDISGTIFDDNNGMTGGPNGTPKSGITVTLYASDGTTALATTTTDANGNYSFPKQAAGNYVVGITLPSGYEHVSATDTTPTDGNTAVTVGSTPVSGVDFGINEPPTATDDSLSNQPPGSPATIPNLLSNDTDPNGGTLSPGNISLVTPSGATNITVDAQGDTTGFTVPGEGAWSLNSSTGALTFTPEAGFTGSPTPIQYTVTDAAGLQSDPATVTINYNPPVTVSGSVFDDNNGMTNGADGTSKSGITVTLYASDGTTVLATTTTDANGNYSFPDVVPGDYIVGVTLPSGYEHVSATDTTPTDGKTAVTVGSTPVSGVDFGINEPPTAISTTASQVIPPPGAVHVPVEASNFGGTDPNGGQIDSLSITSFPTNTTSIRIGNTTYYPDAAGIPAGCSTCAVFPQEGVTVATLANGQPIDSIAVDPAATTAADVVITYVVIDNAGLSSAPATVTLPFGTPLPVAWLSFDAQLQGRDVLLNWSTAREKNTSHFELEYATDGMNFLMLSRQRASGNSEAVKTYAFRHQEAVQPNVPVLLYRIKQVDLDGQYRYSATRKVQWSRGDVAAVTVHPNPLKAGEVLYLWGNEINNIQVVDVAGKVMYSGSFPAKHVVGIKTGGWPKGIYLVKVNNSMAGKVLLQ